METKNSTNQLKTQIPNPIGNGTFSIWENGVLIGYPESSAVEWYMYDISNTLWVTYTGNKTYRYLEVPFFVIAQMLTANSVGKFINTVVKPNYQFHKSQ